MQNGNSLLTEAKSRVTVTVYENSLESNLSVNELYQAKALMQITILIAMQQICNGTIQTTLNTALYDLANFIAAAHILLSINQIRKLVRDIRGGT